MKKFWYVSRDPSTVSYHDPKKAFFTQGEAEEFAEKMCQKTGYDFYVMESMLMVRKSAPPVEWITVPETSKVTQIQGSRKRDARGRFVSQYSYHPPYDL